MVMAPTRGSLGRAPALDRDDGSLDDERLDAANCQRMIAPEISPRTSDTATKIGIIFLTLSGS